MKKITTCILLCTFMHCASAQTPTKAYNEFIGQADSLYEANNFKASAIAYSNAFKSNGGKGSSNDHYNAACSWALAHIPDNAFLHLQLIATYMNYSSYDHIVNDQDLISLYNDKRWKPLLDLIEQNKLKAEAKLNKPLTVKLDSIYRDDQSARAKIKAIEKQYGWESKEMNALWKQINLKDSLNLIKVRSILDTYGWLGANEVGEQGNSALFLVIQHASQSTQEKYLPMMREAVKKGNAQGRDLALLEDRVALGQGKRQRYGSQVGRDSQTNQYYVLPLYDPDHVDQRRDSVGLPPMAEYLSSWKIKWDVEQYKKDLPALETKQKSTIK